MNTAATLPATGIVAPWGRDAEAVVTALRTDPRDGLGTEEAARRLRGGRNVLPTATPPTLWSLVLDQLRETMIVVLLGAAVLTIAVGDLADSAIIALVVTLNTTLGVLQQQKAQRAVAALASLAAPTARVVRAGRTELMPAEELVAGDVVVVAAGDLIPADGRILQAEGVEADEAPLTGESLPVPKQAVPCLDDSPVADRTSMLHAGTTVTRGRARIVITSTGSGTEVGTLARLLVTTVSPPTPLQRRLARFGRQVAAAVLVLCVVVVLLGLVRGEPFGTMLLTGVSLAVAAVPESLPAVVVLSLAMAAQRMARHAAVVRTLPAVETLGAVTVVASDKTGTLTEGTMVVSSVWTPAGHLAIPAEGPFDDLAGLTPLLRAVVLCNDARLVPADGDWTVAGDPMEGALLALAVKAGLDLERVHEQWPRVAEYAFDHARARMTTVHRTSAGVVVLCKGAPEVVLALIDDQGGDRTAAQQAVDELTDGGLRVLAVAQAERPGRPSGEREAERDLQLLGLVGLHDPPRAAAAAAVAGCQAAGVVPLMITGDHPTTAAAIARTLGILGPDDLVVTGRDVDAGLDPATLAQVRVFARIAPEQKLGIVEALRRAGHVVAMTGDGVNDAPALRRADVGVAMGHGGTEVARQAADVVLVDNNFATLVAAVQEGRRVYDNVRRFLLYGLAGGTAEVLLMLAGPAFGLPLPLLPGQILWVNMLTHGLPGVALGAERPEDDTLQRPPRDPAEGVLGGGLLQRIAVLGTLVAAVSLAVGVAADRGGHPWQSMVFVTLTLQQLGIALALRSQQRSMLRVGLRGNPLLLASLLVNVVLLWLAIAWSPLARLLETTALSWPEIGACAAASLAAPATVEAIKAWDRSRVSASTASGRRPRRGRPAGLSR